MSYLEGIRAAHNAPELLEGLYQAAQQEDKSAKFAADLSTCYEETPDSLLYAAWHYRLQTAEGLPERRNVNWKTAIPLAVILSLVFWALSLRKLNLNFADGMPYLVQIWALLAGIAVIAFLTLTARGHYRRAAGILVALLFFGAYAMAFSILPSDRHYETLAAVHLPVLAWIGVGVVALGRRPDHSNRFAFLIKSIELFVVGGIYGIGGGIFTTLTFGLFQTIDVRIPEEIQSLMFAGGLGLIVLLATASTYDPLVEAAAQNFRHGLSKLVATLMRLFMPLTLLVLVVFGYFILQPANFWIPFNNRDALITYNAMLFAVVLLLVGAVPVHADDLAPKIQSALRKGVIAVAILTVLISLYALSATLYRTYLGTITMNRLTVIGWNVINIGLLLLLIYRLVRPGQNGWVTSAQAAFSQGMIAYIGWTICVILLVPHIFGQGLATGWSRTAQPAAAPAATSPSQPTAAPTPLDNAALAPRPMVTATPTPAALAKLPPGCPPDCSSAALAGAYLREAGLRGADLSNADLHRADLSQADLREAKLGGADLRGADLLSANLATASLRGAKIDETTKMDDKWRIVWQIVNQGAARRDFGSQYLDLSQADLSGANLLGANLTSCSLRESDLSGADLSGATLNGVSLHRTIVDGRTRLDGKWQMVWEIVNRGASGRDLSGADLSQADLSQADLSYANLSRAVLTDTNLSEATLYGADLRGAILTEPDPQTGAPHQATLNRADLTGVKLDDATRLEPKWRLVWELVNRGARARALSGADLSGADLHAIDLSGASLAGVRLDGANLQGANLSEADLNGAWLQGTDLTAANLAGANLYEAHLVGAYLPAELGGANLRKTILNGANLWGFKLGGLDLSRAELRGANLAGADLHAADLSEAHLEGAYMWRADLRGANLRGAYLDRAYLWGVNVEGADFTGAELHQTVMSDGTIHE